MLFQDAVVEELFNCESADQFNAVVSRLRGVATSLRKLSTGQNSLTDARAHLLGLGINESDLIKECKATRASSLAWASLPNATKEAIDLVLGESNELEQVAGLLKSLYPDRDDITIKVAWKDSRLTMGKGGGNVAGSGSYNHIALNGRQSVKAIWADGSLLWEVGVKVGESLHNATNNDDMRDIARKEFSKPLDNTVLSLAQSAAFCALHYALLNGGKHPQTSIAFFVKDAGGKNIPNIDADGRYYREYHGQDTPDIKITYKVELA